MMSLYMCYLQYVEFIYLHLFRRIGYLILLIKFRDLILIWAMAKNQNAFTYLCFLRQQCVSRNCLIHLVCKHDHISFLLSFLQLIIQASFFFFSRKPNLSFRPSICLFCRIVRETQVLTHLLFIFTCSSHVFNSEVKQQNWNILSVYQQCFNQLLPQQTILNIGPT